MNGVRRTVVRGVTGVVLMLIVWEACPTVNDIVLVAAL